MLDKHANTHLWGCKPGHRSGAHYEYQDSQVFNSQAVSGRCQHPKPHIYKDSDGHSSIWVTVKSRYSRISCQKCSFSFIINAILEMAISFMVKQRSTIWIWTMKKVHVEHCLTRSKNVRTILVSKLQDTVIPPKYCQRYKQNKICTKCSVAEEVLPDLFLQRTNPPNRSWCCVYIHGIVKCSDLQSIMERTNKHSTCARRNTEEPVYQDRTQLSSTSAFIGEGAFYDCSQSTGRIDVRHVQAL